MNKIKKMTLILLFCLGCIPGVLQAQPTDSLMHYLQVAALNNPGLKSSFLSYKASLEKIPQAGAFEDPEIEMGFFLNPMDMMDGRQLADFKVMQMFPWFGTRKAARTEAHHMAKMAFEEFRESRDNLYQQIYNQWFVLGNLRQRLQNVRENRALLRSLEELAVRKFSSASVSASGTYPTSASANTPTQENSSATGMSGMTMNKATTSPSTTPDARMQGMSSGGMQNSMSENSAGLSSVLRIQLEILELENRIESLWSEIRAENARFNTLLNRPAHLPVVVPDSLSPLPYAWDETVALALITEQNPMLGMWREEGLAYEAKAEMDRKMSYPMFGIGLQYMLMSKSKEEGMDEMSSASSMNGKDRVMPMVSFSVPIYRGKYRAQQRENNLLRHATEEKLENTRNELTAEFYLYRHQLDDARRKIELYRTQSELAHTTYNLIVQEFVTGKSDLSNVIQMQRQLLDYKLNTAEAVTTYNTLVTAIQRLLSFSESHE